MEIYKARIVGVRPLLFNRYPIDVREAVKKVKKQSVFNPEENAKKCLYIRPKDNLIYLPAEHIEGALIKGATQIVWRKRKTYKDIVASSVIVMPREIPFLFPKDPSHYIVDITTGVIPSTRGRIPIARPRWDEWKFEFEIRNVQPEDLNLDTMESILIEAGKIGIGTYRLKYGKFIVEEIVKDKTKT